MGVYSLLPSESKTNPEIRQQYINGHFCYAAKAAIVTNGLGIARHISVFDRNFRVKHPETVKKRTDNPDTDKEIGDCAALRPVLSDFFAAHKEIYFSTFIADSACDSYDNYAMLKNEFGFSRAVIPMNTRNSKFPNACFDASGTPICPNSSEKFQFLGIRTLASLATKLLIHLHFHNLLDHIVEQFFHGLHDVGGVGKVLTLDIFLQ